MTVTIVNQLKKFYFRIIINKLLKAFAIPKLLLAKLRRNVPTTGDCHSSQAIAKRKKYWDYYFRKTLFRLVRFLGQPKYPFV